MTRQQEWASRAWDQVALRKGRSSAAEWRSVALAAPALLQQSGACQAVAFWSSRRGEAPADYLTDLAAVIGITAEELGQQSRTAQLAAYLVLSRTLIDAACWLRRIAQAEMEADG